VKIQLLIAGEDSDYSEFLSNILSSKYTDTFTVGICSSQDRMSETLATKKFDVVLSEPKWIPSIDIGKARLILALWCEQSSEEPDATILKVRKYQRVSLIVSDVLLHYAGVASGSGSLGGGRGKVTAVWSPAGGVGKTSVALAYATRKALGGTATYLDLEHFSGIGAYFSGEGKSISALFEKLAANADILVKSIRQRDSGSGIDYFMPPNNYDDINVLTIEDIEALIDVCARNSDFLVIDLPSVCDKRTQAILELVDVILLVSDGSSTTAAKLGLFYSQHCVFSDNKHKMRLVLNKGAQTVDSEFSTAIKLPRVQTVDTVSIFKTLSGNNGLDL